MRLFWLVPLLLVACAGHLTSPSLMNTEKEFEVPAQLADQFAVRDAAAPAPRPAPEPAPSPPPPQALREKGKAGKKKAAARAPKPAKRKEGAAPQAPEEVPNRWTMPPFFKAGERIVFDITYFGATAGQLELDILPTKIVSERPSFHFRAVATTTSIFSLFYRVNDVAESFMDTAGLFSHKFSLKLEESKQARDVLELYDQRKRKAYYWSKLENSKGRSNEQSEIDLVPFTQDGLSAFFYVRTLPLAIGHTYEFPLVNNGKLRTVRVTALRREELTTRAGSFPAIVVKPEVVLDGALQSYGDSFLWISDDADRQILKIDAKIKVGSVIAYLRERSYGSASASAR